MRWLWVLCVLCGCDLLETERMRAERECFEAAECWRLADLLHAAGPTGEETLEALLEAPPPDAVEGARHALVVRYIGHDPGWAEAPKHFAWAVDAFAWPVHRSHLDRNVPPMLRFRLVKALADRGVTVELPGPHLYHRDHALPEHTKQARLSAWCAMVRPLLMKRLDAGRIKARGAWRLVHVRCPGDGDAHLARMARTLTRPDAAALRDTIRRVIPLGPRRATIWPSEPEKIDPLTVTRAFTAPGIDCTAADRLLKFENGPYRLMMAPQKMLALAETIVAWRQRCPVEGDWSKLYAQMGGETGAAIQAAHAPESMSCEAVQRALTQMRTWVARTPMPASVKALEAAERLRCLPDPADQSSR